MITLLLSVVFVTAVADADEEKKSPTTKTGKADASESERWFELFVRDSKGQPVKESLVEFRGSHKGKTAAQFPVGTFDKKGRYGVFVKPDRFGRIVFVPGKKKETFSISIKADGFGPYHARYDTANWPVEGSVQLVAEMEQGWTVGGRVVDEQGNPIEGAEVHPSIEYKKAPGMNYQLGVGDRRKTRKDGTWQIHIVPDSNPDVHVTVHHSNYMPVRKSLARSEYELDKVAQKNFTDIIMSRGIVVTGRVTDTSGKPIEGALVRSKFVNNVRETKSKADGTYVLTGCEAKLARIVVSAKGKATDMQEVRLTENPEPVDFQMKPGGHVRIVVQDQHGKPLPKARIFYQGWRGRTDYFEFDFKNQYANENGVWEWNEAPLDEFFVDVCRPGGMQLSRQRIIARKEDYLFSPPPALEISGKVIDAKTQKPIESFRVIPGIFFDQGQPYLEKRDAFDAVDGKFTLKRTGGRKGYFVRIESAGFLAKESRAIDPDEGEMQIKLELQPAKELTPVVLSPDGKPASLCEVAVAIPGSRISLRNGRLHERNTNATVILADHEGRFRFTPQVKSALLILHESGFAHLAVKDGKVPETIKLVPWARISGTFQVGDQRQPNTNMELYSSAFPFVDQDAPRISLQYEVKTAEDGTYAFERLFPGRAWVGREMTYMVNSGAREVTSQKRIPIELFAGDDVPLNLGGDGVSVSGQFLPPAKSSKQINWSLAHISLTSIEGRPDPPPLPDEIKNDPEKTTDWYATWQNSPAGIQYQVDYNAYSEKQLSQPRYSASANLQGEFNFDDVTPGKYELTMSGYGELPLTYPGTTLTVTEDKPVDLGELKTEPILSK